MEAIISDVLTLARQGQTIDDGTGIGLAIVSQIAEAHGWRATVSETDGGGARFDFTGVGFVE